MTCFKHKLLSISILAGISFINHPLWALSTDSKATDEQVTAEEANQLAAKYAALAEHYQNLADKLNQNQTNSEKQSDSASKDATDVTQSGGDAKSDKSEKDNKTTKKKEKKSDDSNESLAEIDKKQAKSPWNGTNATLGFQYNTGNTFQRNLSAATNISYKESKNWLHTLSMNYQNAFDYNQDATTANKFFANGQSEYDFSQYNGVYFNVQYLNDQLSGYVYQINENIGYKRRLYKNNGMTLDLFFGPGMQQTRQTQETGGTFHNEPSVQVKTQYKWKMNDKTSYSQTLQWIKTPRHYTVGLTMALTTSLYNSFGLQPSFTLNYDSNPPVKDGSQLKKLDTTTQLSFVYNF